MKKSRKESEQIQRDILARYAATRQSLNRSSHPFQKLNARKTVMERILGNRISAFGGVGKDRGR